MQTPGKLAYLVRTRVRARGIKNDSLRPTRSRTGTRGPDQSNPKPCFSQKPLPTYVSIFRSPRHILSLTADGRCRDSPSRPTSTRVCLRCNKNYILLPSRAIGILDFWYGTGKSPLVFISIWADPRADPKHRLYHLDASNACLRTHRVLSFIGMAYFPTPCTEVVGSTSTPGCPIVRPSIPFGLGPPLGSRIHARRDTVSPFDKLLHFCRRPTHCVRSARFDTA